MEESERKDIKKQKKMERVVIIMINYRGCSSRFYGKFSRQFFDLFMHGDKKILVHKKVANHREKKNSHTL